MNFHVSTEGNFPDSLQYHCKSIIPYPSKVGVETYFLANAAKSSTWHLRSEELASWTIYAKVDLLTQMGSFPVCLLKATFTGLLPGMAWTSLFRKCSSTSMQRLFKRAAVFKVSVCLHHYLMMPTITCPWDTQLGHYHRDRRWIISLCCPTESHIQPKQYHLWVGRALRIAFRP